MKHKVMPKIVSAGLLALYCMLLPEFKAEAAPIRIVEYSNYKVLSIGSYGADAAGANDSSDALEDAVKAAVSNRKKGKPSIVYIPEGNYRISGVRIRDNITIVAEDDTNVTGAGILGAYGANADISVIGGNWYGAKKSGNVFYANGNGKVSLSDLSIKNGANGLMLSAAVGIVENVVIEKCSNCGIMATNQSSLKVTGSKLSGNGSGYPKNDNKGHGIAVYRGSRLEVANTTIRKSDQCGISLVDSQVSGNQCKLKNNGRHGIGTRSKCNVILKKSTVEHNGYDTSEVENGNNGLIVVDGTKAVVENCKFLLNKNTGIWVNGKGSSLNVKRTTFSDNLLLAINATSGKGKIFLNIKSCKFKNKKIRNGIQITVWDSGKYKLKSSGRHEFKKVYYQVLLSKNGKLKLMELEHF